MKLLIVLICVALASLLNGAFHINFWLGATLNWIGSLLAGLVIVVCCAWAEVQHPPPPRQ